ncbi:CRISPR system precrRNA processing endoribonuclease RAMP protein Cas6 [Benzoatithermus flavus]|uniref:CRISPR system precrRNA processing endoribonuclease RAMP protein Cas6 n=1 Tax=Benzoatithermus flavus TaxID=3108223 RepID=A0ABU8XVQ1_9PROT
MRRYDRVPHPYVLQPAMGQKPRLEPSDAIELDVTLIGHAAGYIAYVVRALQDAAATGIGPDRLVLDLEHVAPVPVTAASLSADPGERRGGLCVQALPALPPPCPKQVRVELLTPLRVQRDGHLVGPETFTPGDLLRNLVRRVSMLRQFFTDRPLEADFVALKELGLGLRARHAALRWVDLVRRSSRQDTVMRMGGIVGRFELDLTGAEPLWPYLWLGQWIGAGKGATMGLGRIGLFRALG